MTNVVDVSEEAIEREWRQLASECGLDFSGLDDVRLELPGQTEAGNSEDGAMPPAEAELVQSDGPSFDERVAMATVVIEGGLQVFFDALLDIKIDDQKYHRVANSWAVVICKHFEGGIFEFLARYKDELAAVGATLVFIKAVREGYKLKKEQKEEAGIVNPKKEGGDDGKSE